MPYDLREVVKIIESGRPIQSLRVFKLNVKKKTGGELIRYGRCKIARRQPKHTDRTISTPTGPVKVRNANQAFNFTRNIELLNGSIRTIHPLFVEEINGVPVI